MNRRLYILIGAQRSGKSYFSNDLLQKYKAAGNTGIVYNLGKPTDFAAAKEIFLCSEKQHVLNLGKSGKKTQSLFCMRTNRNKRFQKFLPGLERQSSKNRAFRSHTGKVIF
jgi:hypothetical protein